MPSSTARAAGKLVFGVCNGAQILLEAGLVPGTGAVRQPTAAFTRNAPAPHFVCRHVVREARDRAGAVRDHRRACRTMRSFRHGRRTREGRLAADARASATRSLDGGHLAFVYAHADGTVDDAAIPNGSALGCAGLVNR